MNPQDILPERVLESRHLYRGRVVNFRLDTVELVHGRRSQREIVEHGPVVAMVPLDQQGHVLLVRQYRLAVGETTLEIPAGGVDPGESLEEAAQRELQEETGYRAGDLQPLGGFYVSPGYSSEYIHLFLASDLSPGDRQPDPEEHIALERRPLAEALRLIPSGDIRDAKSIIGLLLAERQMEHQAP